jgi:GNAT superfamily N-acetyltransferase
MSAAAVKAPSPAPEIKVALRERVLPGDGRAVRRIAAATGFFRAAEIEVAAELVRERLEHGEASGYHFLFADPDSRPGRPVAFSCFGPIACTRSSFDLYWIAVQGDCRGRGLGTLLLAQSELKVRRMGGTRMYVETSSRPHYEPTRQFYLRRGYRQEASIPDFYDCGEAKVVYVKELR